MNLKYHKELAANVLNVGVNRISLNPDKLEDVSKAITREDVRELVSDGTILIRKKKGVSRGRWRKIKIQKEKGRRKGHGSRKGTKNARVPKKKKWMQKIRAIRGELKDLRDKRKLEKGSYRKLYMQAKGGMFNSRRHLKEHIKKSKE
ncbi:50S ribosomal protein L19e [Candidatus Altiarchaeales archaeon WOR_SM1_SCG]|nr:50S ribosomal protein L19e [Candidatus Altiarchaeales archaeon WOR_SM1_SCG]